MADQSYFYGTGRRKTATARVRLIPGEGAIIIDGKPLDQRFPRMEHARVIQQPLVVTERVNKFSAVIKVPCQLSLKCRLISQAIAYIFCSAPLS